jgi:hypothetical protein
MKETKRTRGGTKFFIISNSSSPVAGITGHPIPGTGIGSIGSFGNFRFQVRPRFVSLPTGRYPGHSLSDAVSRGTASATYQRSRIL